MRNYTVFFVVCVLIVVASWLLPDVQAQPKPVWIMQDCYTLDDVTATLNRLTPEQAATAKVIAINSQRSMLGALSNPYYVWYRK